MSIYAISDSETAKLIADAIYDSINVCNDVIYELRANIKEAQRYDKQSKRLIDNTNQLERFKNKRTKLMNIRDHIIQGM